MLGLKTKYLKLTDVSELPKKICFSSFHRDEDHWEITGSQKQFFSWHDTMESNHNCLSDVGGFRQVGGEILGLKQKTLSWNLKSCEYFSSVGA